MFYCVSVPAAFAAPTSTLLKETCLQNSCELFRGIKLWARLLTEPRQDFLWAPASAFPGSAEQMALASIAGKAWRTCATRPRSPATDVAGGYAEYVFARADFVFPLPALLDDLHAAPLLCAGIIGFRSLRVAGVEPGERAGLFGFGASAHLAIAVLRYMFPREESPTATWPLRWARLGSEVRPKSRPWKSTAPSPSLPAEML